MRKFILLAAAALLAAPVSAQAPDSAAIKLKAKTDAIFGLPKQTDEARQAGVPDGTLQGIMKIFGTEKIGAEDAGVILSAERDAARIKDGKGSKDNFGAFVQRQHAAGLRGRALADAIHAEQARRGMGRKDGAHKMENMPDEASRKGQKPDSEMEKGKKPADAMSKGKKPDAAPNKGKKPNDERSL